MKKEYFIVYRRYRNVIKGSLTDFEKALCLISIDATADDEEFNNKLLNSEYNIITGELSPFNKDAINEIYNSSINIDDLYWYYGRTPSIRIEFINIENEEDAIKYFEAEKEKLDDIKNEALLKSEIDDI